MPEQLNLLDTHDAPWPAPGARRLSLFLALCPPTDLGSALVVQAEALRVRHGLKGKPLTADLLHVSLHALGDFFGAVPQTHVEAASAAMAHVAHRPLHLCFDRALSFAGQARTSPYVLRCHPESDAAIAELRQHLALALKRFALSPQPSRTPHLTLLYDEHRVAEHAIEPIAWTATDFALVLSHVGRTRHECLARWPLTGER